MQRDKLEVLLTLRDEATKKLGKASQAVQNHSAKFRQGALAMGVAAGVLGGALGFAFRAQQKQEIALKSLQTAISNSGGVWGDAVTEIMAETSRLQGITNFGDEEQIEALSTMISLGMDWKGAVEALPTVLDTAAGAGMDLGTAARGVALAIMGGQGPLSRYIPALTDTESATGRLALITDTWKGQAEATVDPVQQLKNSIGDLAESFGIADIITTIAGHLKDFADMLTNNLSEEFLKSIGLALVALFAVFTVGATVAGILMLANPITLIVAAITALVVGLVLLWQNWDTIWGFIKDKFDVVSGILSGVFRSKWAWLLPMGPFVKALLHIRDNWDTIWGAIRSTFETVSGWLSTAYRSPFGWLLPGGVLIRAILWIKDHWGSLWDDLPSPVKTAVRVIGQVAATLVKIVLTPIRTVLSGLALLLRNLPGFAKKLIPDFEGLMSLVESGISGIDALPEMIENFKMPNLFGGSAASPYGEWGEGGFDAAAGVNIEALAAATPTPSNWPTGEGGPGVLMPPTGGMGGGAVNLNISGLMVMTDDSAVQKFTSMIVKQIRQELRSQHAF